MVVLRAIGGFFARIGRWIKETAWIQPLLIVGAIFAVIFSIPHIIKGVSSWFDESDSVLGKVLSHSCVSFSSSFLIISFSSVYMSLFHFLFRKPDQKVQPVYLPSAFMHLFHESAAVFPHQAESIPRHPFFTESDDLTRRLQRASRVGKGLS